MRGGMGAALRRGRIFGASFLFAVICTGLMGVPIAAGQGPADAGAFLSDLSKRAMAELNQPDLAEEEKQRRFRVLLHQGFDVEAIARFVLGRYWRRASEVERQEFLKIFEDSMVFRFLPVLGDFAGNLLEIGTVRPFGQVPDFFSVESELIRKEGPPVRVDWRVHKGSQGYRILDILAEGVSVAVTLRAEYGSVLKQNGGSITALNSTLRDKIAGL